MAPGQNLAPAQTGAPAHNWLQLNTWLLHTKKGCERKSRFAKCVQRKKLARAQKNSVQDKDWQKHNLWLQAKSCVQEKGGVALLEKRASVKMLFQPKAQGVLQNKTSAPKEGPPQEGLKRKKWVQHKKWLHPKKRLTGK